MNSLGISHVETFLEKLAAAISVCWPRFCIFKVRFKNADTRFRVSGKPFLLSPFRRDLGQKDNNAVDDASWVWAGYKCSEYTLDKFDMDRTEQKQICKEDTNDNEISAWTACPSSCNNDV